MNYTKNHYNKAAKGLVIYLLIGTLAIVASVWLGITNYQKSNTIEKLELELADMKICTLDSVVCPGEAGYSEITSQGAIAGGKQATKASWYDYTLEGVEWSKSHRTTASRDFPRGTMLEITNIENGKKVEVLVNDYGPDESVHPDRALDLSSYAFEMIADKTLGIITVEYREVGQDEYYQKQ